MTGLPRIGEAFGAGELSYSKVRALTRVADRVDEGTLLEQARVHSAAQLERVVRGYRQVDAVDRPVAVRRRARWFFDEDGMLVFSARLTADEGALLVAALEQARTAALKDVDTADPDPEPESPVHGAGGCPGGVAARVELPGDADALVALAQTALAAGPVDSSGDDRHLLVVHADADVLTLDPAADPNPNRGPGPGAVCRIEHGPGLTVGQLRRLACDAAVVAWVSSVTRPGEDLRLGRKTRKISAGLRRALRFRDGGCQFPGCPRKRFLDAHHVVHWADGGPTDLANLLLLCQRHHTAVHEDGFTLHPDPQQPGRWVFHRPDGTPVPQVPDPPAPAPADVSAETPEPTPDPDPDSLRPKQHGERFSLRDSLGVLCTNPKTTAKAEP